MNLGLTLLLACLGLAAIMIGSCRYFAWLMEKMVHRNLRDLDAIRTSGLPPDSWHKKLHRCGEGLRKRDLKRLDGVIRFAKKTFLMEDEDTRAGILRDLQRIRLDWLNQAELYRG